MAYGEVTVRLVDVQQTPEITTRSFDISHSSTGEAQMRRVVQYQYTEWPDFGQPQSCAAFLQMCDNVDASNHTNGPLLGEFCARKSASLFAC